MILRKTLNWDLRGSVLGFNQGHNRGASWTHLFPVFYPHRTFEQFKTGRLDQSSPKLLTVVFGIVGLCLLNPLFSWKTTIPVWVEGYPQLLLAQVLLLVSTTEWSTVWEVWSPGNNLSIIKAATKQKEFISIIWLLAAKTHQAANWGGGKYQKLGDKMQMLRF